MVVGGIPSKMCTSTQISKLKDRLANAQYVSFSRGRGWDKGPERGYVDIKSDMWDILE